DEPFLNGLGAQRIPDPTTAGDFTRRFAAEDILTLQECINTTRQKVWAQSEEGFLEEAVIDVDGTIAGTYGECKGGMRLSYKGIWGYAPLIVTLANTREVLYLVNRPGNAPSHDGAARWVDRAIELVRPRAKSILLRGDTDFSLTGEFDRWSGAGIDFLFGMDAHPKLVGLAEALAKDAWSPLERKAAPAPGVRRIRSANIKQIVVRDNEYRNLRLKGEEVAELEYKPVKCGRSYRLVIVRKNISVERGESVLFAEIRYFFYITTRKDLAVEEVVVMANQRCDQENVIEQLKNGVNAMRMPVNDLTSNWAYMVMASLAWNLKAWYGLLMPEPQRSEEILGMEFRRFLHRFILIPAQIVQTGRRIIYRLLGYNR
ncbi:MAG: IS1380 family transposase, partial [Acidobacteria bacterium]|nr:IS1380 family transposase [Acidobacteriota bacterium]